MRSIRFLSAVAGTAALLAAPNGASARPSGLLPAGKSGPCRVHLEVPPAPISVGESVTVSGTLTCPTPKAAVGRQVSIYQHAANRSGYALVQTVTTEERAGEERSAAFSLVPPPFEVDSVFYAISQGAKSAHQAVMVAPVVTPTAPTPADGAQLLTGAGRLHRALNTVTFAGKVSPIVAGAVVALQRENATATEEWHRIAPLGRVDKNGDYSITHVFALPGDASIRVVVHPRTRLNVGAASSPASYEISQAENPMLTIESKADPLIRGESTKLAGHVKGAAEGTHLTLLSHQRGGHFAPVATTTTGAQGAYEFSVAPLQNTLYKVTDATTSSALLFQGVKYALTVAPVASSVAATQPLEFSGTVLPALVGHRVYLERQGSLKLGWHVIDLGEVTAPGKPGQAAPFRIVHAFNNPGPVRLRIKIPGDPGNQGAAGPALELNVTPTPASLLRPQAPGKLPGEGQL